MDSEHSAESEQVPAAETTPTGPARSGGDHPGGAAEAAKPRQKRRHDPGSPLLGFAARTRRDILGLTQEEVAEKFDGPSVASLRTIENAQADNYRARTLFSLDSALAWPRGFSMVLLTGNLDQLDGEFKYNFQLEFGIDMHDPWGLSNSDWDFFVDRVINEVNDDDMIRYDMPIRSAKPPKDGKPKSAREALANEPPKTVQELVTSKDELENLPPVQIDIKSTEGGVLIDALTYVLRRLNHVELQQFRDMISGILQASDRPILARRLDKARQNFAVHHAQTAKVNALVETMADLAAKHKDDQEIQNSLAAAREARASAISQEHLAAEEFLFIQTQLEEIERIEISFPEGLSIRVLQKEDGADAEHGEATER